MNDLKNLKIILLGDSITEGVGASEKKFCYAEVLAQETGMQVLNYGVGGTRIARQERKSAVPSWDEDFNTRARRMEKTADIVAVFGGTNDYGHGFAPVGTPDDQGEDTFYGAINSLFSYLRKTYPTSFLFVMTPLHRINEQRLTGDGYKPAMLPLKGYVDIIREVAEKYSIPVLDLYKNAGIYPDFEEHRVAYAPDGLHPNDRGHRKLALLVKNFLEQNYLAD